MAEVMDILREEHSNMTLLLDFLERQMDAFAHAEEPDYVLLKDVIDYTLSYPDLYHHPKEDLVYEKLLTRDPAAADLVGDLKAEHARLAELSRHFNEVIENVLAESAVSRERVVKVAREFIDGTRAHMEMEESKFFPAALDSLTEADWTAILDGFEHHDDPLFGAAVTESFKNLSQEIRSTM